MTDILLGAVDTYSWQQIKPWVLSAKESGFKGDIWLIAYRIEQSVIDILESEGVNVYKVEHDAYGQPIQHAAKGSPTQAHNLRFYHAWELLTRLDEQECKSGNVADSPEWIIFTDVRDVIFQKNPIEFLNKIYHTGVYCDLVASSEGIMFEQEDWNKQNMINGYGTVQYALSTGDWKAYNVGIIAGNPSFIKKLSQTIYAMTEGRSYPADQSSFNILLEGLISRQTYKCDHDTGWAAQCGVMLDPTKPWLKDKICEDRPSIKDNLVYTAEGKLFTMVHQWDRVPELKVYIEEKYK